MTEMALTADHLVVIGRGKLLATGKVADFIEQTSGHHVHLVSPDADQLSTLLQQHGATVIAGEGGLDVTGMDAANVGVLASGAGLTLYELSTTQASLEDAFLELTRDHTEFRESKTATTPLVVTT